MRLDRFAKEMANQYLSNEQLAEIRKTANTIVENDRNDPTGTTILKLLNQLILVTADKADMVDVLALQEKLTDRETRLKAMEKAYFEMLVERDWLRDKLNSLEVKTK